MISASCLMLGGCGGATPHPAPTRDTPSHAASKAAGHSQAATAEQQGDAARVTAAAREEARVRQTASAIQRMLNAIHAGGGNAKLAAYALCQQLATPAQSEVASATSRTAHTKACETKIAALFERRAGRAPLLAAAQGQITNVQDHGDHATVTLQLPHKQVARLQLVKQASTWKLATTTTGG